MIEMIKVSVSGFPFFSGFGLVSVLQLERYCYHHAFFWGGGGDGALTLHHSLFHFWTDGRPR